MGYRKFYILSVVIASFISFSISKDVVKQVKTVVVKKTSGYHLGVAIKDAEKKAGAKIVTIIGESEAENIGLKKGDLIIEFDGNDIKNAKQLSEIAGDIKKEKQVNIKVIRDGKKKSYKADLKKVADNDGKQIHINLDGENDDMELSIISEDGVEKKIVKQMNFGSNGHGSNKLLWIDENDKGGFLGVNVKELSDQLKEYFEVKNGVLAEKVIKDSPAEKAGIKAGDIIYRINDKKIEDYADLVRILNYYDPGDKVTILISRKGKKIKKSVELSKKENSFQYHFNNDNGADIFLKSIHEVDEKNSSVIINTVVTDDMDIEGNVEDVDIELYII